MNKNVLFVGNGSNSNRGCEAIIRGTVEILEKAFGKIRGTNIYNTVVNDETYRSDLENIIQHRAVPSGYKNFADRLIKAASLRYAPRIWEILLFKDMFHHIRNSDLVLSIGGDNYSLDYGLPRRFVQIGKLVRRLGKPFVIFGASVGPFENAGSYKYSILEHLREEVDQIHVREDRSYDYLLDHNCRNVFHTADPAFLMPPIKPAGLELNEKDLASSIGINISPLIMSQLKIQGLDKDEWLKQLLVRMRDETSRRIVLIYHVTSPHTNDYDLLMRVKRSLGRDGENIHMLKDGMSAPELKWVISKLACLIGSRTHATIASLSSCIPTVSIAYSVKAWGINENLFGHTDYVVSIEDLTIKKLISVTEKVIQDERNIKQTLNRRIPEVQTKGLDAAKHLAAISV